MSSGCPSRVAPPRERERRPSRERDKMLSSSNGDMFENADALQKLAELNPINPELSSSPAATTGASSASHQRAKPFGTRTSASTGASIKEAQVLGAEFEMQPNPSWIQERLALVESIKKKNAAEMEQVPKPAITITLPDGKEMPGVAWETTPLAIAGALSKGLMQAVCVANVMYSSRERDPRAIVEVDKEEEEEEAAAASSADAEWQIWDVSRPLEGNCQLELIKFDDPRGQETFWHSTAHMVGEALEDQFSAQLTYGPPISSGFFYDSWMGGAPFTDKLKEQLEKRVMKIAGEKQALAASRVREGSRVVRVVGRGGATARARVERPVVGLRRAVGLLAPRPASCAAPRARRPSSASSSPRTRRSSSSRATPSSRHSSPPRP